MVQCKIDYEKDWKKKQPPQALKLFATAVLCAELPRKQRLMLMVPEDHDKRYLLGALVYMLDGASKRTICDSAFKGFKCRNKHDRHVLIKPRSLARVDGKPKIEAGDFNLTLVADAEELILSQECNVDDVASLICITTANLHIYEIKYLLNLGFRIVHTGFGSLKKRDVSDAYLTQVCKMRRDVLVKKQKKKQALHVSKVIKAAKTDPAIEQLIAISKRDKFMGAADYSICGRNYFKDDLQANPAAAAKLL